MKDLVRLQDHLRGLGRVVLGYSGGVDSSLLAVALLKAVGAERFVAVIGRSASYPDSQWREAREVAAQFGVPVRELVTEELADPRYVANPTNRCYFCKAELWTRLTALARAEGFDAVIDGTNADDLADHRPGRQAGLEFGIRSPLAELGFTKDLVRQASRQLTLPTWSAPSSPCLSSRVRYGLSITPERLRQVEAAEGFLRELGVTGDLRVRHLGTLARIEAGAPQVRRIDGQWEAIVAHFRQLGFDAVERDPNGYRRGSLLVLA